jgi:hypothetical protein
VIVNLEYRAENGKAKANRNKMTATVALSDSSMRN